MQDEPPLPSSAWAKSNEWDHDLDAKAENSKWPDQESLQGTKDENTLKLLRHSGPIAVFLCGFSH